MGKLLNILGKKDKNKPTAPLTPLYPDGPLEYGLTAREGRANNTVDENGIRQVAGCLPIDPINHRFLLITSTSDKNVWVIPKGGWEQDETVRQAAMRETWEEAGVKGPLTRHIGTFVEKAREGGIRAHHWIYEMEIREVAQRFPEEHKRERRWFTYDEAMIATRAHYMHDAISMSSISPLSHPELAEKKKKKKKKNKKKKEEDELDSEDAEDRDENGDVEKKKKKKKKKEQELSTDESLGEPVVATEDSEKKKKKKKKKQQETDDDDDDSGRLGEAVIPTDDSEKKKKKKKDVSECELGEAVVPTEDSEKKKKKKKKQESEGLEGAPVGTAYDAPPGYDDGDDNSEEKKKKKKDKKKNKKKNQEEQADQANIFASYTSPDPAGTIGAQPQPVNGLQYNNGPVAYGTNAPTGSAKVEDASHLNAEVLPRRQSSLTDEKTLNENFTLLTT